MKIAYISNGDPEFSTENDVRKAFEFLDHEVIMCQENRLDWDVLWSYDYDLLLITSTWADVAPLEQFLDLFKGCADRNIPTATLHLDTFWGTSRGNRKWWLEAMFHTAYIFTADGDYQDKWKLLGKNHIWLPPAIRHDAVFKGDFREEYNFDVGFAGSCGVGYHEDVWPYRRELIDQLKKICANNGWSFSNPGGELDKPDAGKISRGNDMNHWYQSVKVCVGDSLCLTREKSRYFSDRQMEQWGRNGFAIMPRIDSIDEIFGGNQPFYEWGDFDDLEKQIRYFLENKTERDHIKEINHELVKTKHTYINRVQTILETTGLV